MPRDLILGTAGHIDHGKTSLIKVLTGVDCDRLPDEKRRGITIDIGFAQLNLGEFHLGIVDVPGHERFVKNMLAGATGIDLALLVIAADDSVMPQTREHLEILQYLGLRHGVIAMTKCDTVDDTTREVVELEIRELVADTFLAEAPIIATSAHTKMGVEELKTTLLSVCDKIGKEDREQWFRMAIDRSFVVQGHGTVVTGSVVSGSLKVGDEIDWQPRGETVRVRSLQNHDKSVQEVSRGQRSAINLAGVNHEDVIRGQELATPGYLKPSRVMTVRLRCSPARKPIKHRASIRMHIGTAEVMGIISLLESDSVQPGEWGLAQVFLDEPAVAVWGQPFVVRDASATWTLGGGQVLQPAAKKVRRRHLEVQERIEQLWQGDDQQRTLTVAWFAGFSGFSEADLVRGANISPTQARELVKQLQDEGLLARVALGPSRSILIHGDMLRELQAKLKKALQNMHEQHPLMSFQDRKKVQAQLDYVGEDALVHAVISHMLEAGELVGDLQRIALADHKPKLSNNQKKLHDRIIREYKAAGFQPPEPNSFLGAPGANANSLKELFEICVAEGFLTAIATDIYLHADAEAEMRRLVQEKLAEGNGLTVAEIRDLLGTTRKYAVPFCEYLDNVGATRREGDLRVLAGAE